MVRFVRFLLLCLSVVSVLMLPAAAFVGAFDSIFIVPGNRSLRWNRDIQPLLVRWKEDFDPSLPCVTVHVTAGFGSDVDQEDHGKTEELVGVAVEVLAQYPFDPAYAANIPSLPDDIDNYVRIREEAGEPVRLYVPLGADSVYYKRIHAGETSLVFTAGVVGDVNDVKVRCLRVARGQPVDETEAMTLMILPVVDGRISDPKPSRTQWIRLYANFEGGNIIIRAYDGVPEQDTAGVPIFEDGMTVEDFGAYLSYLRSLPYYHALWGFPLGGR